MKKIGGLYAKGIYKKNREKLIFILIFLISLIIFIPFIKEHFATDTYYIMNKGYLNYAVNNSFKDGRIVMAIISEIAYLCNLPINLYICILTILTIFIACIAVIILKKYVYEKNTT